MFGILKIRKINQAPALAAAHSLEARIFDIKRQALALAKRGLVNEKPGMSHYLRALNQLCSEHILPLSIHAKLDLSGQIVDGFAFTAADFAIAEAELTQADRQVLRLEQP
jgi:hypothetical protein